MLWFDVGKETYTTRKQRESRVHRLWFDVGKETQITGLTRWEKENVRSLIHPPNEALSTVKGEMAKWSFHLFLRGKMKKLLPQWFILPSFGESHGCRIHNWVFCQKIFEVLNKCVLGIDAIDPVGNAAKTWIELV